MPLTPELHAHIRDILKHLKSQGPDDPAVSFIMRATIYKLCREKTKDFSNKYNTKQEELSDGGHDGT